MLVCFFRVTRAVLKQYSPTYRLGLLATFVAQIALTYVTHKHFGYGWFMSFFASSFVTQALAIPVMMQGFRELESLDYSKLAESFDLK